ncbi:MAG: chorismate synthase [Treponema sp.]|jgi:chorismate synthase|nr:chorismate synthase [Treponema sp.]
MGGNTFGKIFTVTTFGESHGAGVGCVLDGCPAGVPLTIETIERELSRRKPSGTSAASTTRREADIPEILSGVFEGQTLGTPIAILVRNQDQHSTDYDTLRDVYRPGHADWTWEAKFGRRDHRGGGRSSGRETVGRVAAGAVAKAYLAKFGVSIQGWASSIAGIEVPQDDGFDMDFAEKNPLRVPHREYAEKIRQKLEALRAEGDSAGGIVACSISGVAAGLGEPVFDKLDAVLAQAMLSIGAAKAVEFGSGFASADSVGSALNDQFEHPSGVLKRPAPPPVGNSGSPFRTPPAGKSLNTLCVPVKYATNNAGGMLGGISTGMPIEFRVAFKPVPSISKRQTTIDRKGDIRELSIEGRHDICIVPRAVSVVEAMSALVLADMMLFNSVNC